MPDTGAPWNIPYVAASDLVKDWPTDNQTQAEAVAAALADAASFDAVATITATDATWSVPTLAHPVVKVTVVGGGGGGGGEAADGTNGSQSSFACSAGTAVAAGGAGGQQADLDATGTAGPNGLTTNNGGAPGVDYNVGSDATKIGNHGFGGAITVAYFDLTGVSTANVTVGAGGAGGTGGKPGGAGGNGVVIVEYRAG